MANKPRYYWDACCWIALIKQEAGRIDSLRYVIEMAQRGEVEIWTSTFTLAEVFKRKCGVDTAEMPASDDEAFEDYLEQDFVQRVQVDVDVGTAARRLLRRFPAIRKPQDAIHVATAALNGVDEFHTFDGHDLLPLDGQIPTIGNGKLKICRPPAAPDPLAGTMFEGMHIDNLPADEIIEDEIANIRDEVAKRKGSKAAKR